MTCWHWLLGNDELVLVIIIMNPEAPGPLYCREQIKIPPGLPDILKDFTKAATRTQPVDLIEWAAA